MNLLVPVVLGWIAISQAEINEDDEEPEKSIITEYKNGNLVERLTVDHSSYQTPTSGPAGYQEYLKVFSGETTQSPKSLSAPMISTDKKTRIKMTIPVYERPNENNDDDDDEKRFLYRKDSYWAPTPTVPQDFLKEINEMKIPKYDLPKSLDDHKLYMENLLPDTLKDNMEDDIEEPDYKKYLNKDYHVPKKYNRFKFNFKGYHEDDSVDGDEDDDEVAPDDDDKTAVKEEEIVTIPPPFRVVTETKIRYEDEKNTPKKFPYNFEESSKSNKHNNHINTQNPCYGNCQVFNNSPYDYRSQYLPNYHIPTRLVHTQPFYPYQRKPIVTKQHYHYHRRLPVNYYHPNLYMYPSRKPYPYVQYYKRLPYLYQRYPAYPKYGYPKHYALFKPYNPVINPYHQTGNLPDQPKPQQDCPPSKIIKEVHVHHYPKGDPKENVRIKIDEANHDENYDHESIFEADNEDSKEKTTDKEHEELIQLSQHLEDSIFNSKKEVVQKLKEGQRFPWYNNHDYLYAHDNVPHGYEALLRDRSHDKIVIKKTPARFLKVKGYNHNYTTPKSVIL